MLRAENAEVADPPARPQVRRAADRRPGHRQDHRAALLLPQRHRGSRRRADRDRPQVRALAHLPADDPARLRQARLVPRPRPSRVRDDPAAADRRPAAGDRGRADRRERRRRAAGHQREPDLPVLAPLPLPRRHRRDRDRHQSRAGAHGSRTSTRSCGPPRTSSAARSPRRAPTSPTSTRPPSSSAPSSPTTCAWRPAASPSGWTRRATRSPASPASRRSGGSSTTPPTSRCGRSSRRATS